jgi:hypothetical protein
MAGDKSLSILLMVLFGISGTLVLILTWMQPMPGGERVFDTVIGAIGLAVALSRIPMLKSSDTGKVTEKIPVEVESEK